MKTTLVTLTALALTLSMNANASGKKLICTNDQLMWKKAEIEVLGSREITFKVLAANRDIDVGKTADLFYTETVKPKGRTFF
ncbi:MAG: hypothetical protein ACXVB9_21805, partial [Bdellovibrionota bacterium]